MNSSSRLRYIDALRGYAILLVIMGHCIFMIGDLSPRLTSSILAYGGRGVQLFFVVSAIALMLSWRAKDDGWLPFYVRRAWRIAPMWWLAIAYWTSRMGLEPRFFAPSGVQPTDVLLNITILHGISPRALMSTVPGGWSIAAEVLFYAVFPALAYFCTNLVRSLIMLAAAALLQTIGNSILLWADIQPEVVKAAFLEHSIINQLPVFILGICIFHAINSIAITRRTASVITAFAIGIVILLPHSTLVQPTPFSFGVCWALLAWGLANEGSSLLINKPVEFIGRISYSAYFWHFIFLDNPIDLPKLSGGAPALVALFAKTLAFTIPLSWLTYRYIEVPLLMYGSRLSKCLTPSLIRRLLDARLKEPL